MSHQPYQLSTGNDYAVPSLDSFGHKSEEVQQVSLQPFAQQNSNYADSSGREHQASSSSSHAGAFGSSTDNLSRLLIHDDRRRYKSHLNRPSSNGPSFINELLHSEIETSINLSRYEQTHSSPPVVNGYAVYSNGNHLKPQMGPPLTPATYSNHTFYTPRMTSIPQSMSYVAPSPLESYMPVNQRQLPSPSLEQAHSTLYETVSTRQQHGQYDHGLITPFSQASLPLSLTMESREQPDVQDAQLLHDHLSQTARANNPSPEARDSSPTDTLNVLPETGFMYKAWSGNLRTLHDAENLLWRSRRWRPAHADQDRTIPTGDLEVLSYARELYSAIIDFASGFSDKIHSENKLNRLVNRVYHQDEIEARCIQVTYIVKDLHDHGSHLLPSSDITYCDSKGKSRNDDDRGKGSTDWRVRPNAQIERDMSFSKRWAEICISVRESKATATDLLDGKKMYDVIYAPRLSRKVKKSNKTNNDNKQTRLAFAKHIFGSETGLDARRARKGASGPGEDEEKEEYVENSSSSLKRKRH